MKVDKQSTFIDKKIFECPQCHKRRMIRPMGHVVDKSQKEFKSKNDTMVTLHVDTCDACVTRNFRTHFEPTKADIKKVMKAIHEGESLPNEASLEDLL